MPAISWNAVRQRFTMAVFLLFQVIWSILSLGGNHWDKLEKIQYFLHLVAISLRITYLFSPEYGYKKFFVLFWVLNKLILITFHKKSSNIPDIDFQIAVLFVWVHIFPSKSLKCVSSVHIRIKFTIFLGLHLVLSINILSFWNFLWICDRAGLIGILRKSKVISNNCWTKCSSIFTSFNIC